MPHKPLIAVIMDEDTSKGGRFYDTNKWYFNAIAQAGGVPIGIPYIKEAGDFAFDKCDGLLSTGARVRFADGSYIDGEESHSPKSDRFDFESRLVKRFVESNRPFFGICNGMQVLGVIYGSKMTYQLTFHLKTDVKHNAPETMHKVIIKPKTQLNDIIKTSEIVTNSRHNEGLWQIGGNVIVSAKSYDGAVEAIEIKDKKFAIGVQWHPELLLENRKANTEAAKVSDSLFAAFVKACDK